MMSEEGTNPTYTKKHLDAMEEGDQKTVTSWCLKTTPARQFLGNLQTQQNFQMVNMGKIKK